MKLVLACIFCYFAIAESKFLPKDFPEFCPGSHPNYSKCTKEVFRKLGPFLLKGIKHINFPKFDPLYVPSFAVNRTLNDNARLDMALKDIKMWGFDATVLKDFTFDIKTLSGRLEFLVPVIRIDVGFNVGGRLSIMDINNSGHATGNFSNVNLIFKFILKPIERLGVKYYTFDEFHLKGGISTGHVALSSPAPEYQAFNDLNQGIFNSNPKPILEAVNPIFEEASEYFFKELIERTLATIPAEDLIPA